MINVCCEDLQSVNWTAGTMSDLNTTTIWRLSLTKNYHLVDDLFRLLSENEKERAAKYLKEKDSRRYVLTRGALRLLLGWYNQQSANQIKFFYDDDKKPYLSAGNNADLHFNVSHSDDLALIAISHQSIGIDIEHVKPDFNYLEILNNYSNKAEAKEITESNSPLNTFYKFWTRKEALLKATGKGIIDELTEISVLNGQNLLDGNLIGSTGDWNVTSFTIDNEYVASIASGNTHFNFQDVSLEELLG